MLRPTTTSLSYSSILDTTELEDILHYTIAAYDRCMMDIILIDYFQGLILKILCYSSFISYPALFVKKIFTLFPKSGDTQNKTMAHR
jgi:hypothetical protein